MAFFTPHTSTPFGSFASPLVHLEGSPITYGVKVYWHQRCKKEGLANVHLLATHHHFIPLHRRGPQVYQVSEALWGATQMVLLGTEKMHHAPCKCINMKGGASGVKVVHLISSETLGVHCASSKFDSTYSSFRIHYVNAIAQLCTVGNQGCIVHCKRQKW